MLDNLKNYLRGRQMLLVLDNFEQVISAASLVSDLLAAAPRLKVLVSSRIVLKIYGEQEFQVLPLELPGPGKSIGLRDVAGSPAIELLLERVRQVLPNFSLNQQNASLMATICARLDGLPLAIELAAVRFKMFKPEIILSGLSNRLQLLVNETNEVAAHQQTLRGAIDWSYSLLEDSEKLLFARLGIFAGGFTAEIAEAVCNPDFDQDFDTLDDLTALLDHSLLRIITQPGEDEPRFGMLETIREFALEKLRERNEQAQTGRHYANYFLELAEKAEPQLTGPDQIGWFQRLAWEFPNFREVIEQELKYEENPHELTLRITGALWRFWTARGYLAESREWLGKVLIRNISGQAEKEPSNQPGWVALRAKSYTAAGLLALEEGDLNQAKAMLEEALRLLSQHYDPAILVNTLNALGTVESYLGDLDHALDYHHRCLNLRRELNDTRGIAISLCNMGALAAAQGQLEQSRQHYEEALSLLRQVGDKRTIALLFNNLGNLWLALGEPDKARQVTEESRKIYRELEDQGGLALALMQMGDIARVKKEAFEAIELYRQSLRLFQEVGEKADLPPCFEGLATALAETKKLSQAARLYGAAQKLRETLDLPLQPADLWKYNQELSKLKQQLSTESFSTEWTIGYSLNIEDTFKSVL
jgi:predicted ATPase/Tfp pilus assembly protein PilF